MIGGVIVNDAPDHEIQFQSISTRTLRNDHDAKKICRTSASNNLAALQFSKK